MLFSWLEQPIERIEEQLDTLRSKDPRLAAALVSRLGRLQRLGLIATPAEAKGPSAGRSFGGYEIVRLLGTGGMGSVYLADQRSPQRRVALKVIRPDRLREQGSRERFQREAKAVAALRDPAICAVFEVGEVDGTPFLAMQYIDGETLAERLTAQRALAGDGPTGSSGPQTAADIAGVLSLIEKVARSLHVAHEAGVVHRDIKPGNLMIDTRGDPVVLDFGLAHVEAGVEESPLTRTGDLLGTPAYMSPEQIRPTRTADRRTDVYSLAATLFECLTHTRPFSGPSEAELYERVLRDPTPDPRRHNPRLPADASAVIAKAMEKDPARRYGTAAEFADDLARLRRTEPVRARRIGTVGRVLRWSQRNPRAAVLMAVLGVALGATSILWSMTVAQRERIRVIAEQASRDADNAVAASQRERRRAEELEQVARFQELQLRGVDVASVGLRIRRSLLVEARQAMAKVNYPPAEIDARATELEAFIAGANFTDLSLEALRSLVFDRSLPSIDATFADQPLVRARLLQATADTARELGLWDVAMAPQDEALRIRRELLGPDHRDTITSSNNLGALRIARGEARAALPILRDVLERTRLDSSPEGRREVIQALLNLVTACSEPELAEEKAGYLQEAEALAAGLSDPSDPLRFELRWSVANSYRMRGDLAGAEQEFRELLAANVRAHGERHGQSNSCRNLLALVLMDQGMLPEAGTLLRENLAIRRNIGGDEHPDALQSAFNLGLWLTAAGRPADAASCFQELLAVLDRTQGPFHWQTMRTLSALGAAHVGQGDATAAASCLQRALGIATRTHSERHRDTLTVMGNLGTVLRQANQIDDAEPLLARALEVSQDEYGDDDPVTLDALLRMCNLRIAKGPLNKSSPCAARPGIVANGCSATTTRGRVRRSSTWGM